jgi:hypothetical protein
MTLDEILHFSQFLDDETQLELILQDNLQST